MRRQLGVGILAAFAAITVGTFSVDAQPAAQINENMRVTLAGNTRPEATSQNDRGAVADSLLLAHMQHCSAVPAQEGALNQLIADQQNPRSANYHKWLTAAANSGSNYGARKAKSPRYVMAVIAWLPDQFRLDRPA